MFVFAFINVCSCLCLIVLVHAFVRFCVYDGLCWFVLVCGFACFVFVRVCLRWFVCVLWFVCA